MISLEQLPSIVQHQIIDYLPYDALLALRLVSRHFRGRVEDQVIEQLRLPQEDANISVISRLRRRPVLDLSVILRLADNAASDVDDRLGTLNIQLDKFNLSKVGALAVKIEPNNNHLIAWDTDSRIYHTLSTAVFESKLKNCDIKSLEIQTDFLCPQCRSFLTQISAVPAFYGLRNLIINLVNFNMSSTVGLYVHLFKVIFNIPSLESFEIRNIDSVIFGELKHWFQPNNIYFSRIRPFVFFIKSSSEDCFLLKFGQKPP